ncbi:hypothetical protein [Caballeronia sp. ATUFL_F1_KS39]|uniref:hypothetical protein n=1 Tax=Caballeronia sp. ATUFL_F1_KS39 TaxID=2921766 RepID=UPI00202988F4|nr:hypothetical protein [Caballeronia sp. ATUFL_F1_KS39]
MILGPRFTATEFQHFAKANIPPGASLGQHADMQRAFFGGVLLMFKLADILVELDDAQAIEATDEVREEANAYAVAQVNIGTVLVQGDAQL